MIRASDEKGGNVLGLEPATDPLIAKLGKVFFADAVTTPPAAVKPFFDVPNNGSTVQVKTVKEATDELSVGFDDGFRYDMEDYSIRADAGLFKQILECWNKSTKETAETITGWSVGLIYQPISNSMLRATDKKGGNILGLKPAKDPLMVVSYTFTWVEREDDEKAYAAIKKLVTTSKNIAKSQNRLADYMYLNYAGPEQKVIESYGSAQVDFLRKVKAKYDPDAVFEKLSPGGFKIPS
ncbi:unnamed protein product [Rhizoctonia solani]|uniref:Berberine/berberine-like domain-containing protein n=1 Tax=Rhizoctonia solani TaxID=456999 RepID=A0A8H2WZN1_9AGAM|nr:unnamed protein product [Rhizoctonia solani]